jgi:sulfur carrier protein
VTVIVTVNGEDREYPAGATVADVTGSLGVALAKGVAVALDGEVVPKGEWASRAVAPGAHLEVLTAIQGG